MSDAIKLTTYCGERDRVGRSFVADALIDLYARHELRTSVLLRGIEGFGLHHRLQSARLLTLSEDLPVVAVAVDARERIEAVLPEVTALAEHGLVTLERARMLAGAVTDAPQQAKLTIYLGRRERLAGQPASIGAVELLRRHGVAGATVLLGVDGTAHGVRRRASFLARNAEVPLMVIAVGGGAEIAAAAGELATTLTDPLMTLERVRVCKRDGELLAGPEHDAGPEMLQKLMVFGSRYVELIARLRAAGAAGATVLRGTWGYHGDHPPHGDRTWSVRRHVPVVTVVIDTPERMRGWFAIVDEMTAAGGLVTSELVATVSRVAAAG